MTVLTKENMRKLEQAAMEQGLSSLRLMENAGSAAARVIRSVTSLSGKRVTVLCGRGNNGGDGFVIARKLLGEGARPTVVLMSGNPETPEAKEMFSRLSGTEVAVCNLETEPFLAAEAVQSTGLIVDAVFGIGFSGNIPDYMRHLFRLVNSAAAPVVAVDIPSGLEADSGMADPDTLRAARTVTFSAMKPALIAAGAQPYYGQVEVVSIGIEDDLVRRFSHGQVTIGWGLVQSCFPKREPDSHKGSYGHLLTVTGHEGMAGAAILSAKAALRCGVGLLTAALPHTLVPTLTAALPEAMCLPLSGSGTDAAAQLQIREMTARTDAVVLGCGLGQGSDVTALVWDVLEHGDTPVVLDADGLNAVAAEPNRLSKIARPLVLTPHPGEMARLLGCTVSAVQERRAQVAEEFAARTGATVVLKGHGTVIASPYRSTLLNQTGNPGMATGGCGDVLSGMIGSFLAQGFDPYTAAMCGVHLHGLAGDGAAARLSQHAMLPSDLIDELSPLFLKLETAGG